MKKLLIRIAVGLMVALGLYATGPLYLPSLGQFLVQSDPLMPAEAIVVLNGDNTRDDRLLYAAQLWRGGLAPRLLLSAVLDNWQSQEDYSPWRHVVKLQLVPVDAVTVVGHHADSTKEEAIALRTYLIAHEYKDIIIVTSNYHTKRAKKVFQKEWAGSPLQFRMAAAPDYYFHPDGWWRRRADSRTFFYEFSKTLWYAVAE